MDYDYDFSIFEEISGGVPRLTEVNRLIEFLVNSEEKIPFEVTTLYGRPQVWYPNRKNRVCDAVCHYMSYGHQEGLIEIMGLTENEDSVEGYLTAEDVYCRILRDWMKKEYQNDGE